MGATEKLARFIVETNYQSIPPEAVHAARRAIIDTFGVMLAGSREPAGKIISSFVRSSGGKPGASVVTAGLRTSPPDAALANGTMAHALDYDDVCHVGLAHPTAALLPAVLAAGEDAGASGKALLEALILGFEAWSKIASSGIDPRSMGFHPTAILGTMGAAAAAARLLRLDIEQTRMALGLAASHAAGIGRNRGTMTKPYHAGNAARSGVISAMLAKEGFTSSPDLIEGQSGFGDVFGGGAGKDDGKLTANLGKPYAIVSPGVTVKKYPACNLTHRSIDAMLTLANEYKINFGDVAEIECQTGSMAADVLVFNEPKNYLQGKFSMQFCLAVALSERKLGLSEVTDEKVNDPKIKRLMKLVRVSYADEPLPSAETVTVRLKDGKEYSQSVEKAKGTNELPLSDEEITAKYRDCAGTVLPADKVDQTLEIMLNLERLPKVSELMDLV